MTERLFRRPSLYLYFFTSCLGVLPNLQIQAAFAQEDVFAIRAALVSVTDDQGARLEGLERQDFQVRERGTPRDVVEVIDQRSGAELFLLVDTSVVFEPHIFELRRSLQKFIGTLGSRFRITLYEFGSRPHLLAGPAADSVAASQEAGRLMARADGAYLLDTIYQTAREMGQTEREEGTPPVRVVILTGTGPELSNISDQPAREAGEKSGAVYDVVIYEGGRAEDSIHLARVQGVLDRLSRESGGSLERVLSVNAIEKVLLGLASGRLQPLYRVSFLTELSPQTRAEDLEVSVGRAGARARVIEVLPGEKRVDPESP